MRGRGHAEDIDVVGIAGAAGALDGAEGIAADDRA
jgi:hypothetical protein